MGDEKRKSAVDRANDLYGAYQNARALYSLAKGAAGAARTAAGIVATSEIWGPILIVLVTVFILTFLIVLGGQGYTQSPSTQPVGQPGAQTPSDLSSLFKSTNAGDGISDPEFYNLLRDAFSSPTYLKLITFDGPFGVAYYPSLDNFVGCQAAVNPSTNTINFYGLSQCNSQNQKYLAAHEAGHIIENRNGRLYQSFPYSELVREDAACYSSLGFLKTYYYAEQPGSGTNPFEESFAEAIALYLLPTQRAPLTNFQLQCPNTYNWVGDNIFK